VAREKLKNTCFSREYVLNRWSMKITSNPAWQKKEDVYIIKLY